MPHTRELNVDRIAFATYQIADKYCGLTENDIGHLHGPCTIQSQLGYIVDGPITRTEEGIASMGVSVCTSWPGFVRVSSIDFKKRLTGKSKEVESKPSCESDGVNENDVSNTTVTGINNDDALNTAYDTSVEKLEKEDGKDSIRTISIIRANEVEEQEH